MCLRRGWFSPQAAMPLLFLFLANEMGLEPDQHREASVCGRMQVLGRLRGGSQCAKARVQTFIPPPTTC